MIQGAEVPAFKQVNVMDSLFLQEHPEEKHARSALHAASLAAQTMLCPPGGPKERDEGHVRGLSYSPTKTGETIWKDKPPLKPSNVLRSPGALIGFPPKAKGQGSIVVYVPHYGTSPSPSESTNAELRARVKHLEAQHFSSVARLREKERECGTLLATLIARTDGRLRMTESYEGVVRYVGSDDVVVLFEVDDDLVEHTYRRDQFVDARLPDEGDRLAVYVHVAQLPHEKSAEGADTATEGIDEQPRRRRSIGPPPREF